MFFAGKNADLAVDSDVQVSNLNPIAGTQVTFKVTARNNSDIVVWGADLDMFINDKLEAGEALGDFPAHSEKTFTFTNTFLASGDYTVKFMADAKKAVPETDEANNTVMVKISVKPGILGSGHSDVAIIAMSLSKAICLQGELVTAKATVKNTGQDTLRGVLATIGPSHKQPVYIKVIPILDPGQEVAISTTLPALIAGKQLIEARVDGTNTIREDNEKNNVQTLTLNVEPVTKDKVISTAAGTVAEKAGKVVGAVDDWLRGLGKPKK
jgi:subtilase family serine protease